MSTKKCGEIKKNLKEYGLSLKEICKQDPDKLICVCVPIKTPINFQIIKDQIKKKEKEDIYPCWF